MRYLFFNKDNKFTNSARYPFGLPEPLVNCIHDETSDVNLTYHDNGFAVDKLVIDAVLDKTVVIGDTIDTCVLSGLPDPCMITITSDGVYEKEEITGGSASYQFDTPGEVKMVVNALHYLPKEFTVNVN